MPPPKSGRSRPVRTPAANCGVTAVNVAFWVCSIMLFVGTPVPVFGVIVFMVITRVTTVTIIASETRMASETIIRNKAGPENITV